MSWNALWSQIDPVCRKRYFTKSEYKRIRKECIRVNSTDLYKEFGTGMSYQEFYSMLKHHFYYDKYVCGHGIEFYYYIKFKDERQEHIDLDDVRYIIYAMGGQLCSTVYTKRLNEQ